MPAAHLARAQHEHPPAGQASEPFGGQGHRGMRQRGDAPGDAGFGAGPLARLHRSTEQGLEHRADGALGSGGLPCVAYLAQYLVLADHHGVEPGGHAEQVSHRVGVVMGVELVADGLGREPRMAGEQLPHVRVAAVEALGVGVDLDAVAGGQQHRLAEMLGRG